MSGSGKGSGCLFYEDKSSGSPDRTEKTLIFSHRFNELQHNQEKADINLCKLA